jgi:MFS transporter, YNFM family, putative membrane transport protein
LRPSDASRAREAILLLALASLNAGISLRCVEAMLPKLASDFDSSIPAAASIITSFGLGYTSAVLLQGPLGDRFGKLRVVTIATGLAGLAALGCSVAWDIGSLAALRFVTGVFASAAMPLGMAYIGDVVPVAERQVTIARFVSGSLFGQTLGPLFGGLFTDWVGWRASFVVLGAVFVSVSSLLYVRMRNDWPVAKPGRFKPFAVHRSLLARPAMRWLAGIGMAETFFFFGAYSFLGVYFKLRFDLSFTTIGLLLAGYGVGGLLYSWSAGWLVRGLGERKLVTAGGVLGGVCFAALAFAPHWAYAIPCTIGLGVAFYLLHNTVQTKATEVAPDARGAAVAMYASAWALGQASGVAAVGFAVRWAGYAEMICAFGLGFCLLGLWLRSNLWRLRP